jgi:hypothetical protein
LLAKACIAASRRRTSFLVAEVEPAKALVGRNNQCIGAFFIACKLPPWRSACREQESLRFRLWRHSHSVPVRWHRGVAAEAGVAQAALAVEQVERVAQPEPQATQAARKAVRAATALLNPPAAKAVRGNSAAQPPGSTGQNSIDSPGPGVGPGSTGTRP